MNIILLSSQHNAFNSSLIKPLGSYQLASWLRQHGYTVKVIDHCSKIDTNILANMVLKYVDKTTVAIGVSSTFWSRSERYENTDTRKNFTEPDWILMLRSVLEEKLTNIDWLLGGPSADHPHQLTKKWVLFRGYGEDSLLQYLDEKCSYVGTRQLFDICTSTMRYHRSDFIQPVEGLAAEIGRGCQFKCKFCQYPNIGKKKGTYIRSIDNIKSDLLYNYETFGTTTYSFIDDTVNEDYDKMVDLAKMAQSLPFELKWVGFNRLDLIWSKPDTIQILKDSGLKSSFFGVESFSSAASRMVGKGWSGKHARDFVLELREAWGNDITFFLSFITGLEGETAEEVTNTVDWLLDNKFYSWGFQPLRIKRLHRQDSIFKSEFDMNYEKYGYRFPKPLNDNYWESDSWNAHSAIEIADQCNNRLYPTGLYIFSEFNMIEMINLGYDIKYIQTTHFKDYDLREVHNRKTSFISNYIEKTMND